MTGFITIIDDFIDTHATTEESMKLGKAIFRSDCSHLLKHFACSFTMSMSECIFSTIILFNMTQYHHLAL
jgi:hypothetical protein